MIEGERRFSRGIEELGYERNGGMGMQVYSRSLKRNDVLTLLRKTEVPQIKIIPVP
jgi:hypothetical protein